MQEIFEQQNRKPTMLEAHFAALGTQNCVTIYDYEDRISAGVALKRAEERVRLIHERLTVFQPESEISLLNASAGCSGIALSADTRFLLSESKRFSKLSNGAFSITTRALSALWEIHARCGTIPPRIEIEHAIKLVCDQDIRIDEDEQTAELRLFGQSVDLGGIAKGYAADEVRRILLEGGVTSALINLGGTICAIGEARRVGIQHPERLTGIAMGRIVLKNACAVTSGDYERFYEVDGTRYHHIVDPRTGYPSRSGLRSVTLVGKNALELDALSTAVFVLGAEAGMPLLETLGVEAVFVTEGLDVFCTKGLRNQFELI